MPYNPSTGVYALPAIYLAIPGTVIIAAQHNTPLEDLATANNYARPIIAGGTGANNSTSATQNLRAVSYDAQSFIASEKATARRNIIAPYAAKNANYTAVADDVGSTLRFTAAATLSLTAAATLANGWAANVIADGGAVTIDPNGSETINGQTTLIVPNGTTAEIICDGAAFFSLVRPWGWETIGSYAPSAVSSLVVPNLSAFKRLRVRGYLTLSAAASLLMQWSSDNGSTFETASNYIYMLMNAVSTPAAAGVTGIGAGVPISAASNIGGISTAPIQFRLDVDNFNNAGEYTMALLQMYGSSASVITISSGGYQHANTNAFNALRILPSSGTISGTVIIEGERG